MPLSTLTGTDNMLQVEAKIDATITEVNKLETGSTGQVLMKSSGTAFDMAFATLPATQKVSSNDTTPGYLNGKLVAGNGITLTENNDGANETLGVSISFDRQAVTGTPGASYPLAGNETEMAAFTTTAGKTRDYNFTFVLDHNRITTNTDAQIRFYKNGVLQQHYRFEPITINGHPFTLTFVYNYGNCVPGTVLSVGLYALANQMNVRSYMAMIDGVPTN